MDEYPYVSRRPQDGQESTLTPAEWREVCRFSTQEPGSPGRVAVLQFQTTTLPTYQED